MTVLIVDDLHAVNVCQHNDAGFSETVSLLQHRISDLFAACPVVNAGENIRDGQAGELLCQFPDRDISSDLLQTHIYLPRPDVQIVILQNISIS